MSDDALKSDDNAPRTITRHPGVDFCVNGQAHGLSDRKWYVRLKPQWKFSIGRAEECTTASFDNVRDFLDATPIPYEGRLTR